MAVRKVPKLSPPFIVNDHGDLYVFETLSSHGVESYDAYDCEYFDSEGTRLKATVNGYKVELEIDIRSDPEPEHLKELIRRYFEGIRSRRRNSEILSQTLEQLDECRSTSDYVKILNSYLMNLQTNRLLGRLFKKAR